MQTTLEETDRHVVRLTVEVAPDELARDLGQTYRKIASRVKVHGFRQGKVPRPIIDARLGKDTVFHEFVEEFVPAYYAKALREHDLAPIADPEIDIDGDSHEVQEDRPFRFTATVEVRPRLQLEPEQYRGLRIDAPTTEPRELEIDEYIDQLRERNAELDVVSRPAQKGDFVVADVRAYVHDKEIPEASAMGYMTEVGREEMVPELDRELEGKRKGDILKFNAVLPERFGELAGTEVTFQVLVWDVKAKRLPVADDEFARIASEFDTLEALREDIRGKLRTLKRAESRAVIRDLALGQLVDVADVDLPERLVDRETDERVEAARERAQRAGMTLEQALASQGWDELRLRSDARSHAVRALKADLALEAIARQEEITVSREDLDREIKGLARASGREPKEVRKLIERSGQVTSLAGDIIRTKALDLVVDAAEVTIEGSPADSERGPSQTEEGGLD
jgi:trigger factor